MDTISSEVGKAYGGTTIVLPSFKRVERGTEGGISAGGTIAGIVAAVGAVGLGLMGGLLREWKQSGIVVLAALVATTVESWIGANWQKRFGWSNEFVNFVNTSIGAVAAVAMSMGL